MKARIIVTGEIIDVYPSIHEGCDYDGSDGYSYIKEDVIILDDEPNYWDKLLHQYAGMAMQGILSNPDYCNLLIDPIERLTDGVSRCAKDFATALVEKLKEKEEKK